MASELAATKDFGSSVGEWIKYVRKGDAPPGLAEIFGKKGLQFSRIALTWILAN